MTMPKRISTWQPVLTDHQSFTIAALARVYGGRVEANVIYLEHPERISQGWTRSAVDGVDLHVHSGPLKLISLLRHLIKRRNDIHIFGSPWEKAPLIICLLFCIVLRCRYYLISEPYNVTDTPYFTARADHLSRIKKRVRPALYKFYGFLIRRSVQRVFAISNLAAAQYAQIGVNPAHIISFGYFVPPKLSVTRKPRSRNGSSLRAVYIGSISMRKGVDTLAETCRILLGRNAGVTIDVYGSGDLSLLEDAPENLTHYGPAPFGVAQDIFAGYDLMVLLSQHDGWAVVVNEALLAGCPVVCTEAVGAARIVREYDAGAIVPTADPVRTADILQSIAADIKEYQRLEKGAQRAAHEITPEKGATIIWKSIMASEAIQERQLFD